jgi:hypothetical protein
MLKPHSTAYVYFDEERRHKTSICEGNEKYLCTGFGTFIYNSDKDIWEHVLSKRFTLREE